jgi:hypothetical protein
MTQAHLKRTPLLDFKSPKIQQLIAQRNWRDLSDTDKIGSAYSFVQNEILFGYNAQDALPASQVLREGYGQCNTKATLLMALLRALGISCRLHGFTIHKHLQRGIVPEVIYPLVPRDILHSWVEVLYAGETKTAWLNLEGFILDASLIAALQYHFPDRQSLCGFGAGTDQLHPPDIAWRGGDTYIQRTGINRNLGRFDSPDAFYAQHSQLTGLRGLLYSRAIRHWMNRRVANMRLGRIPIVPGSPALRGTTTPDKPTPCALISQMGPNK